MAKTCYNMNFVLKWHLSITRLLKWSEIAALKERDKVSSSMCLQQEKEKWTHNNNAAIPAVGREPPKKPVVDLGLLASKNMRKDIAGF